MQEGIASLDPGVWPADPREAAAKEKLLSLLFDRLTALNESGRAQPRLALSWQHDALFQRWEFHLRWNVRFTDGDPLTPDSASAALAALHPDWQTSATANALVIATPTAQPDLAEQLASPRNSIAHRAKDGTFGGTGAFHVAAFEPGKRAVFTANEDDWEGRPFLDQIEVQMGRAARDQALDLEVGKADLVEIPPEDSRRIATRGVSISSSAPVELLALVFEHGRPLAEDSRVREALGRAIDREALWNFLLQKQGEAAGGLLPQWSSGDAFLFSTAADPSASKSLWLQISPAPSLALGYDSADELERAVAQRIVVNAREAGMNISAQALDHSRATPDARVLRMRMESPSPRAALNGFLFALAPEAGLDVPPLALGAGPEEIYARERAVVESYRVVPLVSVPEIWGVGPRVKNWTLSRSAEWRLADVWLAEEAP